VQVERDTMIDGRYRVVKRLGSGGMADVFCAHDTQLGRDVALKVLYRRFAEDEQFVERFKREASSAAGLSHPSIVGVFDRGEWDGTYYIAMELIEGRTLKDVIRERGPAPAEAATDIVTQILRALRFAHQRGVVHRDIKPQNVLVDPEGRVKVTDFGIARAGASDMTETGSIMGTAQYLSPEQAQGRPVDARTDLYSVGVVLYEMLTGRVPFDAESPVTVALKQVSEAPVPPRELVPSIPPALEAVVLRALEKEPARRFADADEFIRALEAARDPNAVVPPPPVYEEVLIEEEEPDGRRWWLWLIAALAVLAIAIGLYLTLRPEQLTVPNVVGREAATASRILQNRGFEVDQNPVVNADVERNRVVGQDPQPETEAEEGTTVTIDVSVGPGEAAVPTVVGLPRDEAESALRSAGFNSDVEQVFSTDVRRGVVIESTPPQGTTIERGTTVTLRVSRGPEQVEVPDVTGETEANARSALEGAGLRVGEISEEESQEAEPGTVLEQSPGPGESVDEGGAVDLTVASEPEPVAVPDVLDQPEADARAALENAGFEVRVRDEAVTDEAEDGMVLDQDPAADEPRPPGSRVTIVVGRFEAEPAEPTTEPTTEPEPTATVGP
jgi:eukaryotic-like serine/threonine-protein kinase